MHWKGCAAADSALEQQISLAQVCFSLFIGHLIIFKETIAVLESDEAEIDSQIALLQEKLNDSIVDASLQAKLYVHASDLQNEAGEDAQIIIQAPPHTFLGMT